MEQELVHEKIFKDIREKANAEVEIDEASFFEKIKTNDPEITKMVNRIDSETQKHRVMMVDYSRGIH